MPILIAIVLIVVGVSWVLLDDTGNGVAGRPAAFGWIPIAVGFAILVWS